MKTEKHIFLDMDGHFSFALPENRPFTILQLTDLHFGFGPFCRKADALGMEAVAALVHRAKPDLLVLTGDSVFPFWPKTGTINNLRQAKKLVAFLDGFAVPYAMVFGNHDVEMGAKGTRQQLAAIFAAGKYNVFAPGPADIFGVGNYIIKLVNAQGTPVSALVLLDSNMYGDGWFYSGFDCIHNDQIDWCMHELTALQAQNPALTALAFFHMPLAEYKTAYEKRKLGDDSVTYHFGSIAEKNDYFGISKNPCAFFERAVQNGAIKGIFCGHDHYNTLSLTYRGIRLTYGMSIDYLGYAGIRKRYTQRGATAIELRADGAFAVKPVPYTQVVSTRVRGAHA